jgi:chemotaxis protein CheZ
MVEPELDQAALRSAIRAELTPLFEDMRRFLDRRIAELSVDVHGAVQMLGFSEDHLSAQLGRLHQDLARVLSPPGAAFRGSGMELESVVQTTEAAANQIMEAAEAINDCVRRALPDQAALADISTKLDAIFAACAFQDVTGQQVRRAIQQLRHVDDAITGIIAPTASSAPPAPVLPEAARPPEAAGAAPPGDGGVSQRDIDALFE